MAVKITVKPLGRAFVSEKGESILQASIRHRVGMTYGCRDGACGSCKCRLVEGLVDQGPHQAGALSARDREEGFILACCSEATTDVTVEVSHALDAEAPTVRKLVARVTSMHRVSEDVMEVQLQLPPHSFDHYRAGQYLDILLGDGARRSYSMAVMPDNRSRVELHIRHLPGGKFSDRVFDGLRVRDILRVEGPYGSFFLRSSTRPIVMLASGTGFAPIKAIIEQMRADGNRQPISLYWGGRRASDLYQLDWVKSALDSDPEMNFVPVLSDAVPEDRWTGRTGFVHHAVMHDFPDLSGHQVYACGAPVVVDSARRDFIKKCGLPADEFFADSFTTARDEEVA